jgi:hypothetical protein
MTLNSLFYYSPFGKEMLCIGSNYKIPSMTNNAELLVFLSDCREHHRQRIHQLRRTS